MTLGDKVYWDSCVFIHRIQKTTDHYAILKSITDDAEAGRITIVTSTLTLAEVVKCDTTLQPTEQERLVSEFFKNPYLDIRQVDRKVAELARTIVRNNRLKPPDAIHIATAALMNTAEFNTYEDKMLGCNGNISVLSAPIIKPCWRDGQGDMFAAASVGV
jgi:predicted nucleic acid-binding protein